MKIGKFKYRTAAPSGYRCKHCGADDCKLWREPNTMASHVELHCVMCARARATDRGISLSDTDHYGRTIDGRVDQRTDQLGDLVPAIPTEDGSTFWGYSSVPHAGVCWWKGLPTYAMTKPQARAIVAVDALLRADKPTSGLYVGAWLAERKAGTIECGMIYVTLRGLEAKGLLRSKEVHDAEVKRVRGGRPQYVYTFPPALAFHLLLQAEEMVRA